jgi:hypothetical protein
MSAKIVVKKVSFIKYPSVFLEVEALCDHVNVDSNKVIVQPKSGLLIPVLICLSKAKIEYTLKYDSVPSETVNQ